MDRPGKVVLNPGDFCFAEAGTWIYTLLGSCVSITLWHPARRVGGACHYMIPTRGRPSTPAGLDGRYADEAVQLFLREIDRHGTRPNEYEVKMFGGGNQFPATTSAAALDISRDNVAAGLRLLQQYGFALTARHVGGTGFRRLAFDLATGSVSLTHVNQSRTGRTA